MDRFAHELCDDAAVHHHTCLLSLASLRGMPSHVCEPACNAQLKCCGNADGGRLGSEAGNNIADDDDELVSACSSSNYFA